MSMNTFNCFCYMLVWCLILVSANDESATSDVHVEEAKAPETVVKKVTFTPPKIPENAFYSMFFTGPSNLAEYLVVSQAKKDDAEELSAKYDGIWSVEIPQSSAIIGDYALVLKSKARHHAVSAKLRRPFRFEKNKQLVVQYEVKFANGLDCGGAYVKLLSHSPAPDLKNFNDKTPYTIMFGPDKCGLDHKLHFIFRHKHPQTGAFEEKHAAKPKGDLDKYFTDKKTHLFTLVLNSDNTFEMFIDQSLVNSGSLLRDVTPSVSSPKEIDDPADQKPADWDDRARITDPTATKPQDWDESEPEFVPDTSAQQPEGWLPDESLTTPDPNAVKPKDWDEEMDGSWEPPLVDNPKCKAAPGCGEWQRPKMKNPKYKGKWLPPVIDNPNYKGQWAPKKIANPNYFEDDNPYNMTPFSALGLELWSMTEEIIFDNFLIVDSKSAADRFAAETWEIKRDAERRADPNAQSVVDAVRESISDRPYLWAIMSTVALGLTILLSVYCCCWPLGKSDREQDQWTRAHESRKSSEQEKDGETREVDGEVKQRAPETVNHLQKSHGKQECESSSSTSSEAGQDAEEAVAVPESASDEHDAAPVEENGATAGDAVEVDEEADESQTEKSVTRKRRPRKE